MQRNNSSIYEEKYQTLKNKLKSFHYLEHPQNELVLWQRAEFHLGNYKQVVDVASIDDQIERGTLSWKAAYFELVNFALALKGQAYIALLAIDYDDAGVLCKSAANTELFSLTIDVKAIFEKYNNGNPLVWFLSRFFNVNQSSPALQLQLKTPHLANASATLGFRHAAVYEALDSNIKSYVNLRFTLAEHDPQAAERLLQEWVGSEEENIDDILLKHLRALFLMVKKAKSPEQGGMSNDTKEEILTQIQQFLRDNYPLIERPIHDLHQPHHYPLSGNERDSFLYDVLFSEHPTDETLYGCLADLKLAVEPSALLPSYMDPWLESICGNLQREWKKLNADYVRWSGMFCILLINDPDGLNKKRRLMTFIKDLTQFERDAVQILSRMRTSNLYYLEHQHDNRRPEDSSWLSERQQDIQTLLNRSEQLDQRANDLFHESRREDWGTLKRRSAVSLTGCFGVLAILGATIAAIVLSVKYLPNNDSEDYDMLYAGVILGIIFSPFILCCIGYGLLNAMCGRSFDENKHDVEQRMFKAVCDSHMANKDTLMQISTRFFQAKNTIAQATSPDESNSTEITPLLQKV